MALKHQCGADDIISQLPDVLLGHILSYVPTKQSVRTSILSKRWVHVWTNVPSIDIDDSVLMLQEPKLVTEHSVHTSFLRFMNCVFDRSPIRKFTLKTTAFDLSTANSWIQSAVTCKVRELDLCTTVEKRFRMHCGLFAYKELFSLKLGKKLVLDQVPDTFSCPGLKQLHLFEVEFDDDSIRKFLSGCPVLEDLHIKMCSSKRWNTLVVNAPALKVLTFEALGYTDDGDTDNEDFDDGNYKFVLECPNLENLNYSGSVATKGYCFENLNSLYEAHIDVGSQDILEHEETACRHRAAEIARGISRAKIIHLTDYTLEIFSLMDDLPIFHNVIELRLGVSQHCSGELFSQLLHNSPNLELLVLDTEDLVLKGDANSFKWKRPDRVPECFSKHLKFLNFWGFQEQKTSVLSELLKYVAQNAKVLEECLAASQYSMFEGEFKINKEVLNYI